MDILSQYKQDNPDAFKEKLKWEPSKEYGFFIRTVMRLSGGRIRDVNKAAFVLTIAGAAVFAVSIAIFVYNFSGSTAPANPTAKIDQRQFSNGR